MIRLEKAPCKASICAQIFTSEAAESVLYQHHHNRDGVGTAEPETGD
jgi:hypothetical protein